MISSKSAFAGRHNKPVNRQHARHARTRRALSAIVCALVFIVGVSLFLTRRASAANRTWDGGGVTNNWSEAANWVGDTVPDSSTIAVFDATSTKNATIDVSINVGGIQIDSGYTGTITQSPGVNITISNFGSYSQADGTFNGGNGNFNIQFSFILSGGTFNAPTGTLSVGFNFTDSGGTFNHNSGTVSWLSGSGEVDVPTSETFNNLSWDLLDGNSRSISSGDTLIVTGNLALNDGAIGGAGSIEARAGLTVGANFDGLASGNPTLLITPGDGNPRTLTLNGGAKLISLNLNAANVTINTSGVGSINFGLGTFTLQAGTVQQGAVGLTVKGYSQSGGIFTGGSGLLTVNDQGGGGNFTLSAGTFTGGGGDINVRGVFTVSGGTFTSTTGTLSVGSFTHSAGTFNHNSGTIAFTGTNPTINVPTTSETFNNVVFSMTTGFAFTLPTSKTLIAAGNVAFNTGRIDGNGTMEARANVTVGLNFGSPVSGSPTILFSGPANQTFTNNGGVNPQGTWTVNKTSGRVTLASNLILNNGQSLNITSGILDQGASSDLVAGPITIGSAGGSIGRLTNQGTGDFTLAATLTVNSGSTISLNGGGGSCGDADSILIRSSVDGTQRTWSGSGNFFLTDVDIKDQSAGNPPSSITVFNGTDSGNNTNFSFVSGCNPTAAETTISGRILDANGNAIEGAVINLSGTQNRKTITDANGDYSFVQVEPTGFYTVTPSRVNYGFTPSARGFSALGTHTEASFTANSNGGQQSPINTTEYFVRQQYLDFLGREPDEAGFNFWVNNIESCGADIQCREAKRIDTSAAFFFSIEHQQTGYLVYRMYQAAYGDMGASAPVPLTLAEFRADAAQIGHGLIVNQDGWQDLLETNKRTFAESFVQRTRFQLAYPTTMTPDQFVDKLFQTAEITPDAADRAAAIDEFGAAPNIADVAARGRALRRVAESSTLTAREFNQAFVLMEYFGYLRRDPNMGPDVDYSGYNFWLQKLESFNGNYQDAEMVKAFLVASEYRGRFPR